MEKRHINRNRRLAAAVAAMALSGLTSYSANASLTLELTNDGSTPGNGKTDPAVLSTPITLDVWATVTDTTSTVSPTVGQGFESAMLNMISTGPILGNLALSGTYSPQSPFNANGSSSVAGGTPAGNNDLDGDGDLDIGSTNSSNASGWWIARSDGATMTTNVSSASFLLGKLTFTPSALGTGTATNIQLNLRNTTDSALWFEDGTSTAGQNGGPTVWSGEKDPSVESVTIGAPVVLTAATGPANSEWIHNADGESWTHSTNWSGGNVPGVVTPTPGASGGDVANFLSTGDTSGMRSLTLDANETIGGMVFNPTAGTGYNILSAGHTLTLNNGTPANPTVTVTTGANTISTAVALGQNTTVSVASGASLTMSSLNSTSSGLTKSGTGSLVVNRLETGAVSVTGGTLQVAANDFSSGGRSASSSKVASLSISSGTLDLTNNTMVISNTSAGNSGPGLVGVGGLIRSGKLTTSIATSTANSQGNADQTTLAYAQGNDPLLAASVTSPIAGQTFGAADTIVKFTFMGDANMDGSVDGLDFGNWQSNFTGSGANTTTTWTEGDFNYDGSVDGLDFGLWQSNFTGSGGGQLGPALQDGASISGVSAVPEPASLGLLVFAAAPLMRRRRK